MRQDFALEEGRLQVKPPGTGCISVYTDPTAAERIELLGSCGIDEHTLNSALDPDEISRVETEAGQTLIIWKRPDRASFKKAGLFEVSSLGIFISGDRLVVVAAEETPPLEGKKLSSASSLNDLVLRLLLETVHHYLGHLKFIRLVAREIESKLTASFGNEHLLRMFALSESLIYYLNAIETNGGALARLRALAERRGFTEDERGLLEDLIIENAQCGRQAAIYSQVLSGLMDARGNIINNNMNVLLKNLTVINVVFLPLGVLAGVGGMSEFSMMTQGHAWWWTYPLFVLGLTGIGLMTWKVLGRWMNRVMGTPPTAFK